MKKVLIVSHFFPPCNLTASQRTASWAKNLHRFGYYPVVITRRWDHKINTLSDVSRGTPQEILHEKHDGYEVYYLPYKANLRDKLYVKYGENRFLVLRRMLTFFEVFLQGFTNAVIPYRNMFTFAEAYVKNNHVYAAVISGNPFIQFKLGYTLNKKFGLKWIADYRDAWTTSEINFINRSFLFKVINVLERYFEKKWTGTAIRVTASSGPIAESIEVLTGVKSGPLYNGFVAEDFDGIGNDKFEEFTITYVGTLYDGQKVEIMCEAYKQLVNSTPAFKGKLLFTGLAFYQKQAERIAQCLKGYENYYECTLRIERNRILEIEKRSHLLFHVAWDEQKGIIASKIYEYIASGTPVIVVPGDGGSVQEIVETSGCGVCINTAQETKEYLSKEYENFLNGVVKQNDVTGSKAGRFSRLEQTKNLALIFNEL